MVYVSPVGQEASLMVNAYVSQVSQEEKFDGPC